MSKRLIAAAGTDGWVRLDLGKGSVLKIRASEYYAGIAAGKAEQRATQQAVREQAGQAQREADMLDWIEQEGE